MQISISCLSGGVRRQRCNLKIYLLEARNRRNKSLRIYNVARQGKPPTTESVCVFDCVVLMINTEYSSSSSSSVAAIGVDLAGILGGRMARAEGGLVPSGLEYGEGCPLLSRLGGLGSVVSSPSGVRGGAPAENGFWHIL